MFFERNKIKSVREHIHSHATAINALISTTDVTTFEITLNSINDVKQYDQGEQISAEHLNELKSQVKTSLIHLTNYITEAAKNPKSSIQPIADPVDYLLTVTDYLYVMAQEKLGCPNIPLFIFDQDIKNTLEASALAIDRSFAKFEMTKESALAEQRGKDAKVVGKILQSHMKSIHDGVDKPKHVGEMIAEYQALKERQSNHGAIWRFFHPGENKARTALLKQMRSAISASLPQGMKIDLTKVAPAEIARRLADARIRGNVEVAGPHRIEGKMCEKIFGCAAADDTLIQQPNAGLESEFKEPLNLDSEFVVDANGKKEELSAPVSASVESEKDVAVAKEGNEFCLFN